MWYCLKIVKVFVVACVSFFCEAYIYIYIYNACVCVCVCVCVKIYMCVLLRDERTTSKIFFYLVIIKSDKSLVRKIKRYIE